MTKRKRFIEIQKLFFYPIIKYLIKKDDVLNNSFYGENTMALGFYGYAEK